MGIQVATTKHPVIAIINHTWNLDIILLAVLVM
jgi:hypothetical protein